MDWPLHFFNIYSAFILSCNHIIRPFHPRNSMWHELVSQLQLHICVILWIHTVQRLKKRVSVAKMIKLAWFFWTVDSAGFGYSLWLLAPIIWFVIVLWDCNGWEGSLDLHSQWAIIIDPTLEDHCGPNTTMVRSNYIGLCRTLGVLGCQKYWFFCTKSIDFYNPISTEYLSLVHWKKILCRIWMKQYSFRNH